MRYVFAAIGVVAVSVLASSAGLAVASVAGPIVGAVTAGALGIAGGMAVAEFTY